MFFVNYCIYISDGAKVASTRPAHREYIARLWSEGKILAAGPFMNGAGGLFVYEATNEEEARRLAEEDPYAIAGVLASTTLDAWTPVNVNPRLLVAS
jgi:uncharacterized protein YciI